MIHGISAAYGWAALAAIVVVYVVLFDLNAHYANTHSLSGQFHDWLINPAIGPIMFGVWFGIFVGLTFHWFEYKGR
jgi:hypothetical protein